MKCLACGADNGEQARYCSACGRNLTSAGFDSRPKLGDEQESEALIESKDIDKFGHVYWSDELWMWQIGVFMFAALVIVGVSASILGLFALDVFLTLTGIALVASAVAILFALRRHPRAASYSSVLYGHYRLGESEANEVREVYESVTNKPPCR
ncbi:MAG: hypothetical protein MUC90_00865 [Thermoplasmata archaeon]|jgi:hypothetical protein|nr:hypothetical protein [Thermoplasmata archaeon]